MLYKKGDILQNIDVSPEKNRNNTTILIIVALIAGNRYCYYYNDVDFYDISSVEVGLFDEAFKSTFRIIGNIYG